MKPDEPKIRILLPVFQNFNMYLFFCVFILRYYFFYYTDNF